MGAPTQGGFARWSAEPPDDHGSEPSTGRHALDDVLHPSTSDSSQRAGERPVWDLATGDVPAADPATAHPATADLDALGPGLDAPPGRPARQQPWFTRGRLSFRAWRQSRPFWGGLFSLLGGSEILLTEKAPFKVVVHFGPSGVAGLLIPALIVVCGLLLWFSPQPRAFYAILVLLLSLGSWVYSNLGGFFLGMTLGIVGGALALTWTTAPKQPRRPRRVQPDTAGEVTPEGGEVVPEAGEV